MLESMFNVVKAAALTVWHLHWLHIFLKPLLQVFMEQFFFFFLAYTLTIGPWVIKAH